VVRKLRVRYDRVTTGICRYHCSRVIGIAAFRTTTEPLCRAKTRA
jgi:hypothetical protein